MNLFLRNFMSNIVVTITRGNMYHIVAISILHKSQVYGYVAKTMPKAKIGDNMIMIPCSGSYKFPLIIIDNNICRVGSGRLEYRPTESCKVDSSSLLQQLR